jgi:hypothetical protein
MKILLIQENGHHFGNRIYRECFAWQRALQEYDDIEVTIWGQKHVNFQDKPNFNTFDVIICLEQYDSNNWVPHAEIAKTKAKKLLWAVDSHSRGIDYFRNIKRLGKYESILCSILHHVGENDVWFPNAYDDLLIKPLRVERRAFLGFCGNTGSGQRLQLIKNIKDRLREDFIFDEFVIGDKMVEAINSYDIHFNFNVLDDINYRSFETIGCKIPLITNDNYQYEKLGFKDDENCIIYKNENELIEKISFYKENKTLLDNISVKGYQLSANHTYRKRIEHLKNKLL